MEKKASPAETETLHKAGPAEIDLAVIVVKEAGPAEAVVVDLAVEVVPVAEIVEVEVAGPAAAVEIAEAVTDRGRHAKANINQKN